MRVLTEEQQKKRQHSMEWQIRNRWAWTALFSFSAGISCLGIFEKRSQWPHLFAYPLSAGIPVWDSVWGNIFGIVVWALLLTQLWMRVHNSRREQIAAEQEALRKASTQAQGVWPPPPQKF